MLSFTSMGFESSANIVETCLFVVKRYKMELKRKLWLSRFQKNKQIWKKQSSFQHNAKKLHEISEKPIIWRNQSKKQIQVIKKNINSLQNQHVLRQAQKYKQHAPNQYKPFINKMFVSQQDHKNEKIQITQKFNNQSRTNQFTKILREKQVSLFDDKCINCAQFFYQNRRFINFQDDLITYSSQQATIQSLDKLVEGVQVLANMQGGTLLIGINQNKVRGVQMNIAQKNSFVNKFNSSYRNKIKPSFLIQTIQTKIKFIEVRNFTLEEISHSLRQNYIIKITIQVKGKKPFRQIFYLQRSVQGNEKMQYYFKKNHTMYLSAIQQDLEHFYIDAGYFFKCKPKIKPFCQYQRMMQNIGLH